jgi:hypothetical protein
MEVALKYPDENAVDFAKGAIMHLRTHPTIVAEMTPALLDMYFDSEYSPYLCKI